MLPQNILELAKQGNVKAIAMLINHSLHSDGITAKVALKADCLQVMLESEQVPQKNVIIRIRQGLIKLEVAAIKLVKIYGKKRGDEIPSWHEQFELDLASNNLSEANQPLVTSPNLISNNLPSFNSETNQINRTEISINQSVSQSSFPPNTVELPDLPDLDIPEQSPTSVNNNSDFTPFLNSTRAIKTSPTKSNIQSSAANNSNQVNENDFIIDENAINNTKIKLVPASQTKRLINFTLDLAIMFLNVMGIAFVIALFFPNILPTDSPVMPENESTDNLIGSLIIFIYYAVSEAIWSKTPAKFITKTKVVNKDGQKPTSGQIVGRTLCRFIPFDWISFCSSQNPLGWHDSISGTMVVEDESQSEIRIFWF